MVIWQSDLWHYSDATATNPQWSLLICDRQSNLIYQAQCPQREVNSQWLQSQLEQASQHSFPEKIQIFRPQIEGLFRQATKELKISLEITRRTPQIKSLILQELQKNKTILPGTNYLALDRPPPQNLPEQIWGKNWNFVSIPAGDLLDFARDRPLPVCDLPESLTSLIAQLDPKVKIPGIVIDAARKSMILAQWLAEAQPVSLNYIPTEIGQSGGLVLEAGLVERWIIATFESADVAGAAKNYEQAKQSSQGLHFLLIQPDDSGMTHTGFWLLKDE